MELSPALAKLTSDDRRRILEEYDSYPRGDVRRGALLRRHGLYSSQIAKWRERVKRGQTDLSAQAPGPKPQPVDPLATELARLTRENARLQAELEKATLIIDVQKNCHAAWDATAPRQRRPLLRSSVQELAPVVGGRRACRVLGMPRSSYYQAHRPRRARPLVPRTRHPRALTDTEQAILREWLNSERFADCAPRTVYATLLDDGIHLCHWSTMYRLLRQDTATRERRAIRRHPVYAKPELLATAPRQVWSWDITMLRGPRAGLWYRLYTLMDIFSRMVVGWLVAEHEDALLAERLIADACVREQIGAQQLTIHADRGAVMQSQTLAILLEDLGVQKSHSRPAVSNDNPDSEAQFKTMKYGPTYPDRFGNLAEAETWVATFMTWYNTEHRHSGIGFLTPQLHHAGHAIPITAARQSTLDAAYAAHPERFPRGRPHPPVVPAHAGINLPLPTPDGPAAVPTEDVCSANPATAPRPAVALGSRVSAAAAAP